MSALKPVKTAAAFAALAAATVLSVLPGQTAEAAAFNVFSTGSGTLLGTFEADPIGGQVSSASFSVGGITFDSIDPADIPEYRPVENDLTGPGETIFANFYNSVAESGCTALNCVLFFEKINLGPPDEYVYGAINLDTFDNIAGGDYTIAPVPLPPALTLMLLGLGSIGLTSRRRKGADTSRPRMGSDWGKA